MKKFILFLLLSTQTGFAQQDFFKEGNDQLSKKNYKEAEILFRKAAESDNNNNLMFKAQLALSLIEQGKSSEAEKEIQNILKVDPDFTAALWYGGINSFQNMKDFRKSVLYFEKAYPLISKQSPQYFAVNFFVGKNYRNLLQTEGLTYSEVDRMIYTLEEYVRLQPNAEDANEITSYIERVKKNRPPSNVKIWAFTNEKNAQKIIDKEVKSK